MYNAWSRSTLECPNGLEVNFIAAPPYHSSNFTSALLAICSSRLQKRALVYDISVIEPQVAINLDLGSSDDEVSDIAWGPEGRFYLLMKRSNNLSNSNAGNVIGDWRVEGYELDVSNPEAWTVRQILAMTSPKYSITSLAVQSRLGGLILGSITGDLYHRDATGGDPRKLGKWCSDEAVSIIKVKRDRLIACISKSGKLSLALASLSAPQIVELCPERSVSTVSFSHELPTLAVGLADGPPRVRLFEYGWESNRVVATPTRELVVFGPSLVEEERWLGGVRDVDFGTGSSIACLFHGRTEPVVFHATSGRRTTSGSANQKVNIGSPSPSMLGGSPRSLPTGVRNHTLTWAGPNLFFLNSRNELCREGFSCHAAQAALYRNDPVRFAVLGVDYCSLLNLEGNPRWTRYDCPSEYVSRHGPLRKISIDDDRARIAVAGKRGLCVFFAQSRKWKTFQSETLENRLIVGGLFFMPTGHLGIIAQIANSNDWELQILNLAEKRLDVPPVYRSGPLPHGLPICVDFLKTRTRTEMFMLFTSGIAVYRIASTDGDASAGANSTSVNGSHRHDVDEQLSVKPVAFIARPPTAELGFVISMSLVPSKLESVLPRCVVIDSAGRAVVINLETHESSSLAPSFRVADAWTKTDPTLGTIVWTVIDRGLKLWVPALDPSGELYQCQSVVDVSFTEVGALPVGSDEDAFICFQSHLYDVRGSKSPVLHGILGWLLRRGRDGLARRVLAERRFSRSVRLVRAALEDLLQGALLGENQVDVRRVVNLLGCVPFEVMAAVVARCARQIDIELWDDLFSIVGAPRDFFEQCLVRFDTAPAHSRRNDLILIAAELLPIVDADKNDPPEGPAIRAKMVLRRCDRGSNLEKEVVSYAEKRGLDLSGIPEDDSVAFSPHDVEDEANEGLIASVLRLLSGN